MSIPENITREHVLRALRTIDIDDIPKDRRSKLYDLSFEGDLFPPKYVISIANQFANGEELDCHVFHGGVRSNSFLEKRGFRIIRK